MRCCTTTPPHQAQVIAKVAADRQAMLDELRATDRKIIGEVRAQCDEELAKLRSQLRREKASSTEAVQDRDRLQVALSDSR